MGITWDEFSNRIIEPIIYVKIQAALSLVFNLIFSSVAYQKTPRQFAALACYFGFCHLIFLVPVELCEFSFVTIYLFVLFYLSSLLLHRLFGWSLQNTLKFFVFVNSLYCFRKYQNKNNIDDFVLTYITLTAKLFCAVECFEKNLDCDNLQLLTLLSYLTYTPWISLRDFLCMSENNQRHKNAAWWLMVTSATPRAIIYKILSHNLADFYYNITDPWMIPIIYSIIHGFQYRCRYYFRAQIVELQLLAAGVQKRRSLKVHNDKIRRSTYERTSWLKPYIFDLPMAESSISVINFLKRFNKPLFPLLEKCFKKRRTESNKFTVLGHAILLLLIISAYNWHYAGLSSGFLGGVMMQGVILKEFSEMLGGLCFHTCSTPFCRHRLSPKRFSFYFMCYVFLFHNQFRLSLVFARQELMVLSSYVSNNYVVLTDICSTMLGWLVYELLLNYFKIF